MVGWLVDNKITTEVDKLADKTLVCPGCGREISRNAEHGTYFCEDCGLNVGEVLLAAQKARDRERGLREGEAQAIQRNQRASPSSAATIRPPMLDTNNVPVAIKRWSWPAFIFGWLWCFFNGLPVWGIASLVGWIFTWGFAGLIIDIVLGAKGNEYAWKARHFSGVEEYWRSQRVWVAATWIFVILVLGGLFAVGMFFSSFASAP